MEGSNSNRPNERIGLNGNTNSTSFGRNGNTSSSSHNGPRNHYPTPMSHTSVLSQSPARNSFNGVLNGLTPLMLNSRVAEAHRKNVQSWMRRPNVTENNTHSPDSFVINFDNANDPGGSSTVQQSYGHFTGVTFPEQLNQALSELGSGNNSRHMVHQFRENNPVSSNNTISNNIHVNDNGRNNLEIPTVQNAEGPQDVSNSSPSHEVQSLDKFLHKYFPFITFLVIKALYDRREGIFIFVGLLVTFTHANSVVKREIAKQSRRSLLSLSILIINLFVCTCFIYFVFKDQKLYKSLILIPPYNQPLSIWDLLWIVGITDFVLKFITIQIKAGMACFPARLIPYSSRGKWYLMLECSSQLYRGLAPIQPWLYYLMEAYQGPEKAVGVFFSVAYMVSKGTELLSKAKVFLRAFWKLLQNVSLGVRPSKEQLDTAGSLCPICHDEFTTPELLHCRHVFCETCIATWFDREQTCPLCRAKIADDPSWRDGATTFFTQLF